MIEKINNNQIPEILEKTSSPQSNTPGPLPHADNMDASIQVSYASLIDQATHALPTDAEAVQRARELLSSGQLENPENIQQAAKNIIMFGI